MSNVILPSLAGLGFDVTRTPVWDTTVQQAISGKETRVARQTYPRWKWELTYSVLRSGASYGELQELAGFFNALQGMFDTFLYQDVDDNNVTGQLIAQGDGSSQVFYMVRSFGGFNEPMLAPNTGGTINVYLNGVLLNPSTDYIVNSWGTSDSNGPGALRFVTPPVSGAVISADFTYYWPCRMSVDSVDFSLFLSGYYKAKKFSFISVKN